MTNSKHPDIILLHRYATEENKTFDKIIVSICPIETKDFPYGLALEASFGGEDRESATKYAIKIQQYLNSWGAAIVDNIKRKLKS